MSRPRFIVVEGPIGVGKTTLARRLADHYGSDLVLEAPDANPFLPAFYADPTHAALPTQLFFLFQRVQQVQALRQDDMFRPVRIADYLLEKDRLFAGLTLGVQELRLYDQVYERVAVQAPVPDLVIYLQAPVDVLLQRIAARGISYERQIDERYLERLVDAYVDFFYHYTDAPLLIVNAAEIDLATDTKDLELLVRQLEHPHPGRCYFNPTRL